MSFYHRNTFRRAVCRVVHAVLCAGVALCFSGLALADDGIQLSIRDASGFSGGQVRVPITLEGSGACALLFWVEFDHSKLEFVDVEAGSVLTAAGKEIEWGEPEDGRISFLVYGINEIAIAPGKVMTLVFDVADDAEVGEDLLVHGLNQSATDAHSNPIRTSIEDGEITILACFKPAAPGNLIATDGIFSDHVQLTWTPALGAQSYTVYRSQTNNPATAAVIGVTILPYFSDVSVIGAIANNSGGGCTGGGAVSYTYTKYYYWVMSKNLCGHSALTAAESGYSGRPAKAKTALTTVDSLPALPNEGETEVAVFLGASEPIDAGSVGAVEYDGSNSIIDDAAWMPLDASATQGWVIVTLSRPLEWNEPRAVTVAAKTFSGATVTSPEHTFSVTSATRAAMSPNYPIELASGIVPDLVEGVGSVYRVQPELPSGKGVHIELPVPDGVAAEDLMPNLYVDGPDAGWCPAPLVAGWISPGSLESIERGNIRYIAFDARFGGIIQLGVTPARLSPAGIGSVANLLPFAASIAVLGIASLRRRLRRS